MSDLVKVGDYELLEKRNEGEWFDEYKARNQNTKEIVLMARVRNGLKVKRIESRFTQLKECSNEHLVRYIDIVKKDDELWIVMENCDCYSLSRLLEHKDYMTEEHLRGIARGCLLGLNYLHERGIMHGDVRPVNLFLTEDGVLKMGYYGLTIQAECYRIKEMKCDGVRSFAPEVFRGEYEMKSDVWSLGIALLELMGIRPYYWRDNDHLPTMNGSFELPYRDTIKSSELADFLEKCFYRASARSSVNELLNHPFVKECEGGNEVLIPLTKMLKDQECHELMLKKNRKDSYLVLHKNGLCWYQEGLIEKIPSIVVELCLNGMIEVDIASHTLIRVNGEDVKGIEHKRVLDLSDDGERWEGDVLNNQPYGWGVLYDSENRIAYEGFRIGDVNVCYGRSYFPDVQKVEYEGGWLEGMRWGRGIQYDRNGKTVFDGEWMNDDNQIEKRVVLNEENQLLHSHIEELIVENNSCNGPEWTALDLSFMSHLRLFKVGEECFESVKEVKLIGLNQLEKVVIGEKCFTKEKNSWRNDPNRHFHLKDCERLRELKMGRRSFSDYSVCEIENVPSLRVIEMGEMDEYSCNFYYASLELKNMPSLKSLWFGGYTFHYCSRAVFENLPELISIRLGKSAFEFENNDSCELIMRNLPKLRKLTIKWEAYRGTFEHPRSITLEGTFYHSILTYRHALSQHCHS
ncbi:hypothetical protein WA577_006649 [Blastocystis sp. JDR]